MCIDALYSKIRKQTSNLFFSSGLLLPSLKGIAGYWDLVSAPKINLFYIWTAYTEDSIG